MMTDPISDMLTRIRNANALKHEKVAVPHSEMKEKICAILKEEGFISDYTVSSAKECKAKKTINIALKYTVDGVQVISGLKRISKPGLRVTVGADKIPNVLNGLGIAIISTSKGLLTDKVARSINVGGEVICYVW